MNRAWHRSRERSPVHGRRQAITRGRGAGNT